MRSRYGRRPNPTPDSNPNPDPKPQPKRASTARKRGFLGTPFRLRDDIPRDAVTPGQNGTTCMGCGHRGTCLCGNEIPLFPGSGAGNYNIMWGAFIRALDFTFITGPRHFCLASTAVWCIRCLHTLHMKRAPISFDVDYCGQL